MKNNIMNAIAHDFIRDENYLPVRDKNGNYALYSWRKVLKQKEGNNIKILEILDGDKLDVVSLQNHLEKNQAWLDNRHHNDLGTSKVIDIFVFNKYPGVVKEEEIMKYANKQFCLMIVDLDAQKILCNKDAFRDIGYQNKVKHVFTKKNLNEFDDLDKVYNLVNDYNLEISRELMPSKMTATYSLIMINVGIYLLGKLFELILGEDIFRIFGIKSSPHIALGEYWRLVTPMFLHADIVHLASNMFSLFILGQTVEKFFGSKKMYAIYFLGGIMGNLFSFTLTKNPSLGASGAVFAIGGAIVLIWVKKASRLMRASGRDVALVALIAINIFLGFANTGIDNFAHLGGLIGGFLLSVTLGYKNHRIKSSNRWIAALAFIVIASFIFYKGYNRWIEYILQLNPY